MDILEKSYPNKNIVSIMNILKYNKNPLELVGTGSMKSQYYPADYDFLSKITNKLGVKDSYIEFMNILHNIHQRDDLFFVEFKIQDKNDNKYKVFKIEDLTLQIFEKYFNENLELCKIDCIVMLDGIFKELSVIYFFNPKKPVMSDYIQALLKDQKHYYDDKKYYKSLKRLMLAGKYESPPDKSLIMAITELFNSSVGALYQLKNEIDACIIFMDKYKDKLNQKRVQLFIKNIGFDNLDRNQLEELSNEYGKLIDKEALKFYKMNKLKVSVLPKYNSIKPLYA
jgi:hypothetical protein